MSNVIWTRTSPQKQFMQLDCKFPAFVAGFGCVSPDTKIWTDEGLIRISDIKPLTRVLSWNEKDQKFQLSLSGGSYPKGRANLHRVATQGGEFDATGHHHVFSSLHKYESVASLSVGSKLSTVSQNLLSTISELDRLSSALDVQHYSKIDEDSMLRYVTEARLYGLRLLSDEDIYQEYLPLLSDARKLCQCGDLLYNEQKDVLLERLLAHSRHGQYVYRQPTSHSSYRTPNLESGEVGQTSTSHLGHTYGNHRKSQQSALMSKPRHNDEQHSSVFHSFKNPLTDSGILSVEALGEEVYWDMQVLGTNNYVTECGVIHHNTGKSEVMCQSAICDAIEGGSKSLVAMYEPTYDLVRLILAPRMEDKLSEAGIVYNYNKSENIIYTSTPGIGDFVLRTLDNPSRIVGYESFRAKIDELDTLKPDHAKEAWIKIIARNRQSPSTYKPVTSKPCNTVSVFTTPEGFRFVYDKWKKNPGDGYEMIQASTMSNPFLPDDYVDSLRSSYPDDLIEAYLNGEFVNLTGGTVYNQYTDKNRSYETIDDKDYELHIGMDFNVTAMAACVYVYRDGFPHCVDEFVGLYDTKDMIEHIKMRYPDKQINVYPDASGRNRKSNGADETDITLLEDAGFYVYADSVNPRVKTRVNSMNAMFCNAKGEHRLFVNRDTCPETHECLQQQVYNDRGEPDKKGGKDHQTDAAGYVISYLHPIEGNLSSHDKIKIGR